MIPAVLQLSRPFALILACYFTKSSIIQLSSADCGQTYYLEFKSRFIPLKNFQRYLFPSSDDQYRLQLMVLVKELPGVDWQYSGTYYP